ncbi:hypothetical protein UPYG_G00295400 [Umbra pygmaea]|uniref:Uncharacterized protein n=1 Tax=Umbra pygmaea TaxID=75934 RepID=A0ABD0WLP3_UMBPY
MITDMKSLASLKLGKIINSQMENERTKECGWTEWRMKTWWTTEQRKALCKTSSIQRHRLLSSSLLHWYILPSQGHLEKLRPKQGAYEWAARASQTGAASLPSLVSRRLQGHKPKHCRRLNLSLETQKQQIPVSTDQHVKASEGTGLDPSNHMKPWSAPIGSTEKTKGKNTALTSHWL